MAQKKATTAGKTVTVRQKGSRSGQSVSQRATLTGLGLTKREQVRTLQDTPEVRGMIRKVLHLVDVIEPAA